MNDYAGPVDLIGRARGTRVNRSTLAKWEREAIDHANRADQRGKSRKKRQRMLNRKARARKNKAKSRAPATIISPDDGSGTG